MFMQQVGVEQAVTDLAAVTSAAHARKAGAGASAPL